MTLNLEQIKEIIPHRDPFLLIDEVTELEPGVRVTAKKYLKPDEYWFKGHFPGQPVTPGVLMIEMLAQAGAVFPKPVEARHQRRREHPLPVLISGGVSVCTLVQEVFAKEKDVWFAQKGLGGDNAVGAAVLASMR